jgi:hypothetical protein
MASKNNKRKYAAVALGIVGIAGLSLASAATLNVNEASPLVGVSTGNECDTAVDVAYTTTFTAGAFKVTEVKVSGIAAACAGQPIKVYVLDNTAPTAATLATVSGTVPTGTGDQSLTLAVTSAVSASTVYNAAVAIS